MKSVTEVKKNSYTFFNTEHTFTYNFKQYRICFI